MLSQLTKNNYKKTGIIFLILISKLFSQNLQHHYDFQLNSSLSKQWWSNNNNFGQKPSNIKLNYNGLYQKNGTDYTISLSALEEEFYIGESFIKSKLYKNTYIKFGRYYKDFSAYLNDDLSSGSMLISNNAQPMPKIGILSSYELQRNININFTFGIAHALFNKNNIYTNAPMLHEKFLYLNYIEDNNKFSAGFVHEAMWGGSTKNGSFPESFKDFLKVFISADGPQLEGEPHANALGNHLGIWDFSYEKKTGNKALKIYYQHFFEDTSGLRFDNKSDGLWGIELSNFIKNTDILFEYLNTMNQNNDPPYLNDNYYNHYQYQGGWSYEGYALGNPFINYLNNNPLKVFHLGISSNDSNMYSYKLLASRKIHMTDYIKYHISVGKIVDQYLIRIIMNGNENMDHEIGFGISRQL
tara:strand:+ start:39 stop:1277 length:1239 start_codon:yes stop_codon:yes gene_type:complete